MQPTPAKTSPTYFNLQLTYEALSNVIRENGRQKDFPLPTMKQMEKDVGEILHAFTIRHLHTDFPPDEMMEWVSNEIDRRIQLQPCFLLSNPIFWFYMWACVVSAQEDESISQKDRAFFLLMLEQISSVQYRINNIAASPVNSWWLPAFDQAGKLAQALKGLDESVLKVLRDGKLLTRDYQPLPGYNRWHKIVIVEEYAEFLNLPDKPWAQFELLWRMSRRSLKKHADSIPEVKKKKEVDAFRTKIKECLMAQKRKNSALGL